MGNSDIEIISSSLYNIFKNNINYIIEKFYLILNGVINSSNYKYYISILLTLVFIILVILTNLINVPDKYLQVISLFFGGFLLSIFYFFIYRNENEKSASIIDKPNLKNYYNDSSRKIIKVNDKKYSFDNINFTKTVSLPITNMIKFLGILFFTIFIIIAIIGSFYNLYNKYQYLYIVTQIFIGLFILVVSLSIIAKLASIVLTNCEDSKYMIPQILCIVKNFIFFIPCLLIIIIDEFNKDVKATPSSVYLLFILLLILVGLFIGIPLLFQFIISMDKNDLLAGKGPYYLDNRRVIGTYQDFSKKYILNKNKISLSKKKYTLFDENPEQEYNIKALFGDFNNRKFQYKYTYSISFYIYLNPQPTNTSIAYNKETELFNYGNKPVILYDGRNRKLLVKSKTQTSEGSQTDIIYETKKLKYQKWMLFTINYQNNIIDVFIDGKLVGSKKNVPPYFDNDTITIGEDKGIHGSIKDIYYYETPRPVSNIEFLYNLTIKPTENEASFIQNSLTDKLQKQLQ